MSCETPHTLVLSVWDQDEYTGEDFGYWDEAEITCPHQPPNALMPCALWEPCGCRPALVGELDLYEEITEQDWACSVSPTGTHRYIEDEPNRPIAMCWTLDWDQDINRLAFDLGLRAGTYLVRPWWDGDTVQLDLIDPLVATS